MVDVVRELGHLTKLAREDPNKRFNRLYRLLRQRDFLILAKTRVQSNKGANTPGVDGQVMADVAPEVTVKLSQELADGLTDHRWSVYELLSFKVSPPRWTPPKRRERRSKETLQLIERWC